MRDGVCEESGHDYAPESAEPLLVCRRKEVPQKHSAQDGYEEFDDVYDHSAVGDVDIIHRLDPCVALNEVAVGEQIKGHPAHGHEGAHEGDDETEGDLAVGDEAEHVAQAT